MSPIRWDGLYPNNVCLGKGALYQARIYTKPTCNSARSKVRGIWRTTSSRHKSQSEVSRRRELEMDTYIPEWDYGQRVTSGVSRSQTESGRAGCVPVCSLSKEIFTRI